MKANELRIGNWVLIPMSLDGVVIPSFEKQVRGIGLFGGIDFTEPQFPGDLIIPAVHCAGIPLTEKWLLKFGFECWNECDEDGYAFYVLHNVIDGTSNFEVSLKNCKSYPSIDENCIYWGKTFYVHTLQNLYFALTGEELTIKEDDRKTL